ncbi:hypothetical protein BC833DRAFT_160594 [Globomyces pollinis-pini]|nr:hypothetical protein BC833DRAFT_160594 [Globomyces pollinis-pini]
MVKWLVWMILTMLYIPTLMTSSDCQNLESSDYLPLLEFVPDLCYEHQGSYTSLQELFYEISSRVLALACRNKDATADLVEHLCEWIKLFFQSILDNPTNEHFCTLLIAALQGIFQSFNSGNVSVLENFGPMFSQSIEQIIACPDALSNMSRELKISNLAERHDIPSFYTYVFEAMKNMVINFISPQATFTSVWEDLLLMKQNLRPILQEFLPVLSSLSSLTWNQDKKAIVCDQGDALFPELTVNMIVCFFHIDNSF